ncbi:MAG TPA: type II toxin-antitoxin system HipA family toxin, partial [Methylophilaceae bacterium]|nr:type II toxin-antitoxin system HipA family toxin [Methylophilaceae bacterium]
FNIGGENKPSNINQDQVIAMSESLRFKPKYVLSIAEEVSNHLLATLDATSEEINTVASVGTEKTMVERLNQHISSNTKHFQKRLFTNQM